MSTEILKLDKDQLKFLLKNHECFSENEVKIAAKRLTQWKDKPKRSSLGELQRMAFDDRQRGLSNLYSSQQLSENNRLSMYYRSRVIGD